jgi:murein DD-endopeptidase MepM/ murein hydrolase activator NlpD
VAADFWDSLLGTRVSASTDASSSDQTGNNYLTATVSAASILQDKNNKNDQIDANADVNIVDSKALQSSGSAGVSDWNDAIDSSCGEPDTYVVKAEDSISKVAKLLGVTENTVLAANDMKKKLVEGDILFIPKISGIELTVTKGLTMQSIAKRYKVDVNDIAFCNGIAPDAKLAMDTKLVIPGGKMIEASDKPVKNLSQNIAKDTKYYENYPTENLAGLINPVPGYRLSQSLHDGNAVDLAIAKGTPIHAATSGIITFAKSGRNGGFGYLVIIDGPNDVQTWYAHMSKIIVHAGDQVDQNQIIGKVGSTGRSTGPHLHFAVKGAPNPGVFGNWANIQIAGN